MKPTLTHAHRAVYQAILRRRSSHNLAWRDVQSMLSAFAEVVEEGNGALKVHLHGRTLVLHPGRHKEVGTDDQLGHLRDFLKNAERDAATAPTPGVHLLVVIDHRQAKVYTIDVQNKVPLRIVPHQSAQGERRLHDVERDGDGQRRPELRSFYRDVAASLVSADSVLLFGGGTGASSAMEHLLTELRLHHPATAAKLIGVVVVDESHTTEDQLLARARTAFASSGGHPPAPVVGAAR